VKVGRATLEFGVARSARAWQSNYNMVQHLSISLKPWRSDSFPTKFHLPYILVLYNRNIKEIY
jgi:hypothetical protein